MTTSQFVVLLPVKPPAVGKSRLVGVDDEARQRLAEAFAQDTASSCLAAASVRAVLAVTDDAHFSSVLVGLGCAAIPDGVSGDLNATLRQAAAEARRRWPGTTPVALCADLPALRSDDLDALLGRLPEGPAFVPDAAGVGTTLYTAAYDEFDPRFGGGSRLAHLESGAREIVDASASVRRDVDDAHDLADAVALGVGERTAEIVAELPGPRTTTGRHPEG